MELKVSRRFGVQRNDDGDDEQQHTDGTLFIGVGTDGDYTVGAFVDGDTVSYLTRFNQKEWKKLHKESDVKTDEEFISILADRNFTVTAERSGSAIKVKWVQSDDDGLDYEFCSILLHPDTGTNVFRIVSALLKDRDECLQRAVTAEATLIEMHSKMDILGKMADENAIKHGYLLQKVEEMQEYTRNLTNTLVSKFVVIMNTKTKQ